jgi:type IV pilus biogenesis protein CpaD/CtpE
MTKVAILAIPTEHGDLSYRAIAGEKHAHGKTAGEALDALTAQLSADEASTLIIIQSLHPDRFFTAAQQQRLDALMARWRSMRDQGVSLPADEQAELEALIAAELQASAARAAALADALGR